MIISKEEWLELKSYIKGLQINSKYLTEDEKYNLRRFKKYIKQLDSNSNKIDKIYVITNNAIVDDEIDYSIYGVALNKNDARKIFNQAVRDAKCDSDFKNLNAINIDDKSQDMDQEEWYYSKTDNSFELYLNGEYNSNNFLVEIKEFDIPIIKENNKKREIEGR